jgi:hypothetical protein
MGKQSGAWSGAGVVQPGTDARCAEEKGERRRVSAHELEVGLGAFAYAGVHEARERDDAWSDARALHARQHRERTLDVARLRARVEHARMGARVGGDAAAAHR